MRTRSQPLLFAVNAYTSMWYSNDRGGEGEAPIPVAGPGAGGTKASFPIKFKAKMPGTCCPFH
jgi:hypothetical protein